MDILRTIQAHGHELDIYGTPEEPLFLAVDVARIIDYSVGHTSHMLNVVDPGEKVLLSIRNIGASARGNAVGKWFLTEYGLYEVLMQSRKPIARSFKAAVKDILHDLRIRGEADFEDWLNYDDPLVEEWEMENETNNTLGRAEISWRDFLESKGFTEEMLEGL